MFRRSAYFLLLCLSVWGLASCGSNPPAEEAAAPIVQTPVTVAFISHDTMSEYVEVRLCAGRGTARSDK